ncbi:hypothetical protein GKZ68_04395 [Hymenobacter sp. BRD128]|uniref:hypothetical protein n=1 Tax=Hymenobacter sp. BRD128 TaxID=2675878 RepID=UPI001563D441|nr:hypothetical protein [Hymenobacter sp. BRD128]QKG55946.1 hypothetical protein GKZ68_04395 [Hymenobacter sp. BRD128]
MLLLKIPYFGSAPKSGITELCAVSGGLFGFWLIYWAHLHLIKSSQYQTSAATFTAYAGVQRWLANFIAISLLLSICLSPWLAAQQLLN